MSRMETLTQQAAQIDGDIRSIQAAVEAENRVSTPEELTKVAELNAQFDVVSKEIEQLKQTEARAAVLSQPAPRVTKPMDSVSTTAQPVAGATSISGGTPVAHNYGNHGFKSGVGEFLVKVREAKLTGRTDPRLMVNAVTTFGGEGVGADGAFALPPDFVRTIMDSVMPQESFLRAMNPVNTNSTTLVVPVNENPAWGSSGITSAKTAEGAAITASKPALKEVRVTLYKAASLVHVSEEALSDIPFLASWVMTQMGDHLRYQLENWVINGTGEGEPLGIRNANALIALADVDSDATTIGAGQVLSMEASLLPGNGAFFVGSPTVLPAIATMKTGSAGFPLFQPDMTVATKQAILGRPFYRSEACPVLNTAGDLILVQPSGYMLALKAGGVQTATTVGFAFDQDLQSFRATLRVGGAPLLSAKVTRANGSTYASHFVTNVGSKS